MPEVSAPDLIDGRMPTIDFFPADIVRRPQLHGRTRPANIDHESAGGKKCSLRSIERNLCQNWLPKWPHHRCSALEAVSCIPRRMDRLELMEGLV
jgi:hypothetical protein